jgi:hypothetical protein
MWQFTQRMTKNLNDYWTGICNCVLINNRNQVEFDNWLPFAVIHECLWAVKFVMLWFILLKQEQQKACTGEKPFKCDIWSTLWKECHIWKASLLCVDASLPPTGYVCVRWLIITPRNIEQTCNRICNSWRFSLWFKLKTVPFLYMLNYINCHSKKHKHTVYEYCSVPPPPIEANESDNKATVAVTQHCFSFSQVCDFNV